LRTLVCALPAGRQAFFSITLFLDARMNLPDSPLVQAQAQALAAE
jgi:hypothetical protein